MSEHLTESYKWLVQQSAWKDLEALLSKIVSDSNKDLDFMDIDKLSATVAAHARGLRDAVAKIRSHVDYQLGGGPK